MGGRKELIFVKTLTLHQSSKPLFVADIPSQSADEA